MIKDHAYFLSLSFDSVPAEVRVNPEARAIHELWGDLITAIALHTQNKPIDTAQMETALGVPDRVVDRGSHELWIYDWHGTHGPNRYASETPFIVRDGFVYGISRNND